MLEPSARYSAGGVGGGGGGAGQTLQIDTHHSGLETAVDLSRKAEATGGDLDADQEDSEDDAPLDLKVKLLSIIYLQLSWMVFILYKKVQLAQKLILGPLELPCNLIV
jgi:hypothetical protein